MRGVAPGLVLKGLGLGGSMLLAACGSGDRPRAELAYEDGGAHTVSLLLEPDHPAWLEPAPDTFRIRVETSVGTFVIEGIRAWAPRGADRFFNLVRHRYYDDTRFHRVVPGFIVQWGLHGDPAVNAVWTQRHIPDDTVAGAGNARGTLAFAFAEPGTRATQVFINLVDNRRLDPMGFPPFGRIVDGMEVVDRLHGGYGEESGGGLRAGRQGPLAAGGNEYVDAEYPLLTRLLRATIES